MQKVILSYIPLFDYSKVKPGTEYPFDPDWLQKHVDNIPQPRGVLWFIEQDEQSGQEHPGAAFLYDDKHLAERIADHLTQWLDGDVDRMWLHIEPIQVG